MCRGTNSGPVGRMLADVLVFKCCGYTDAASTNKVEAMGQVLDKQTVW